MFIENLFILADELAVFIIQFKHCLRRCANNITRIDIFLRVVRYGNGTIANNFNFKLCNKAFDFSANRGGHTVTIDIYLNGTAVVFHLKYDFNRSYADIFFAAFYSFDMRRVILRFAFEINCIQTQCIRNHTRTFIHLHLCPFSSDIIEINHSHRVFSTASKECFYFIIDCR